MKKVKILIFAMFLTITFSPTLKAQNNLVPNPSFEIFDTCPNGASQIRRAIGWSDYSYTTDYFNVCASNSSAVSVPSNQFGVQHPRTGNAYAGGATYNVYATNARECMGIKLNDSLIIGQKYYASFFVSRAGAPVVNVASNKIGIRLSTVSYSLTNPIPIDNHSQVYTDSIITDTLHWTKISGSFIADSNYKYLSIGNFFTDSLTSIIRFDTVPSSPYYYIDDICLSTDSVTCNDFGENIDENNIPPISIFPNPARYFIIVEGEEISKISVYDILGVLCFSVKAFHTSLNRIDISSLRQGVYAITIETSKEKIRKKIIIY